MSDEYLKSKAAAEKALAESIDASSLKIGEALLSIAMVYAVLALAEAIRENKNLNVTFDGRTRVYLDGGLATVRKV